MYLKNCTLLSLRIYLESSLAEAQMVNTPHLMPLQRRYNITVQVFKGVKNGRNLVNL